MGLKIIFTAIAMAVVFITGSHVVLAAYQREVLALFLAFTACIYAGAVLTPAGAIFWKAELPFVCIVYLAAIAGLVLSPVWLAVGYFIHGGWDLLHHYKKVATPVVQWFPPLCAIFDFLVAAFVLWWWLSA